MLKQAALHLRNSIWGNQVTTPWPPLPSKHSKGSTCIPEGLKIFLQHLLAGKQETNSPRVQCLINSIGQDLVYGVTCAKQNPAKHIMLLYTIKSLTGSAKLINIINHLGHGVSYSQIEDIDTALCLQNLNSNR